MFRPHEVLEAWPLLARSEGRAASADTQVLAQASKSKLSLSNMSVVDDSLSCQFMLLDPDGMLGGLVDVMALRLAHDKSSRTDDRLRQAQLELEEVGDSRFDAGFRLQSAGSLAVFNALPTLSKSEIVKDMRINYERTDPTSVYHKRIIETTAGQRKGQSKLLLGYTCARFSGQKFAKYLAEATEARTHAEAGPQQRMTVRSIMSAAAAAATRAGDSLVPADFFSPHFLPQRPLHFQMRKNKMTLARFLEPSQLRKFRVRVRPKLPKLKQSPYRMQRSLCGLHGFGPLLAKNMWRIISKFRSADFTEAGRSGREFALLMNNLPTSWNLHGTGDAASQGFDILLQKIQESTLLDAPPISADNTNMKNKKKVYRNRTVPVI